MKDTDKILFGVHEGKRLIDIPASYFLYIWEQAWFQASTWHFQVSVREYIKDNLEVLKSQVKRNG